MEIKYFKLVHKLNQDYKQLLIESQAHFRASVNSFSLISVSQEKPELGVKCSFNEYVSLNNLEALIKRDIQKVQYKEQPNRFTPEKKLQAWIINHALQNNQRLPFEPDIKFITSELALKDQAQKVVTDILGYSESKNQLCVIELKSDRLLKRLIDQVNNFEKIIIDKRQFFNEILKLYGYDKVVSDKVLKIVVWPYKINKAKPELENNGIIEFTYHGEYTFSKLN